MGRRGEVKEWVGTREWLFTTVGQGFCSVPKNGTHRRFLSQGPTVTITVLVGLTVVFIYSFGICRKSPWWQCKNRRDKERAESSDIDSETVQMRDGRSLI